MFKIHELILTFFYCGKVKKAPGTVGSLASVLVWFFTAKYFYSSEISFAKQNIFWIIFLISSFAYGCLASPVYTKKFCQIDHSSIVLDEVVGQIFTLQFSFIFLADYFSQPKTVITHLLLCFALFRFFDIKKPFFIGYCDRNFKNGFGVMFDDLLSGIVAAIITVLILTLLKT